MGTSEGWHEDPGALSAELLDRRRAILSIREELEAVDWYDQRVQAATDPELARILAHNRDEEKEHASMVLEWLRRRDPTWDANLRRYLFTTGDVVGREAGEQAVAPRSGDGSLGIGSLRGRAS